MEIRDEPDVCATLTQHEVTARVKVKPNVHTSVSVDEEVRSHMQHVNMGDPCLSLFLFPVCACWEELTFDAFPGPHDQ